MPTQSIPYIYTRLSTAFGPQHWWPADSPFEVVLGAVLTQNTRWENVRMALDNLRGAGVLVPGAMASLEEAELQALIRPAGFFRQKSATLRRVLDVLVGEYGGSLEMFLAGETPTVRARLLNIKGVGPETADSILLYAGTHPIFVIDAYTRRICSRIGVCAPKAPYAELQHMFMHALPEDVQLYNEYHALLVELAKCCCTKNKPQCNACPLEDMCRQLHIPPFA
ncbi:MAG: endonuclease III domain-containing protein [Desulfuromonadaceae bacterium]|nr:endonuclease III domain-containing protein [Geobacteraceae bacterium]